MSMAKESPSVEECLAMDMTCTFRNLRRASRAVTQVYDAYFDEIGLKATQFTVLAALLYDNDGRNLSVLERLGYITLVPGDDRRERTRESLTPSRAWKTASSRVARNGSSCYPSWLARGVERAGGSRSRATCARAGRRGTCRFVERSSQRSFVPRLHAEASRSWASAT